MGDVNYNVCSLSVEKFAQDYSKLVIKALKQGYPISKLHSVFLWGAPGVGKSQGITRLAEIIEAETGKKVVVTDIRLLLFNPVDLRGIPTANSDKTAAVWLKPKIFDLDDSSDVVNLLFLDELSAAPQSVQAAAYQLVLDRKIGEHSLPDNTIVIGAGNRVGDNSVAYNMPKALANRFSHFEIISDTQVWLKWAEKNGINPLVIGYISFDATKLVADSTTGDIAFPTPRTWEFVSDLLNLCDYEDEISEQFSFIASYIGKSVAQEFITWVKNYNKMPSVINICEGVEMLYPKTPDEKYVLCKSLVVYIESKARVDLSDKELENMSKYVNKFPKDYTAKFYADLLKIKSVANRMDNIQEFQKWVKANDKTYRTICTYDPQQI